MSDFLVGLAFAPRFLATNLLFNGFTISAAPLAPTINASQLGSSGKTVGYDGLESQLALDPDVPGYVLALNATPLTTTTGGSGISQIENVLEFLFRVRGVSPKCVFVNSQD